MHPIVPERQLTSLDHVRLFNLVRTSRPGAPLSPAVKARAEDLLDLADLVDPRGIGAHVVTMRSRVRLRRADGQSFEVRLSYPDEASAGEGLISVFSPLGLGLIGARLGDLVQWTGPDGDLHSAELAEILYQPEAAGDFTR